MRVAPRGASAWRCNFPSPSSSRVLLGSTGFPASARLHRPAEFAAALKGRWIGKGAWLVLSGVSSNGRDVATTVSAPPSQPRLGLIIAKRFAPHAVTRNALKRVIREAFRQCRATLPARDYVVRLHAKVAPGSLTSIKRAARAEIDSHFQRVLR